MPIPRPPPIKGNINLAWSIPEGIDNHIIMPFKLIDKDLPGSRVCNEGICVLDKGVEIYQRLAEVWVLDCVKGEVSLNDPVD